jgi:3-oxoacyl-[acyl-carrier protein] reductase
LIHVSGHDGKEFNVLVRQGAHEGGTVSDLQFVEGAVLDTRRFSSWSRTCGLNYTIGRTESGRHLELPISGRLGPDASVEKVAFEAQRCRFAGPQLPCSSWRHRAVMHRTKAGDVGRLPLIAIRWNIFVLQLCLCFNALHNLWRAAMHKKTYSLPGTSVRSGGKPLSMPFTLEGKTALVTGSGRGIGRAIANKLAAAGASVMVNDLDEAAVTETDCGLRKAGYQAAHLVGDLTDPAFPDELVQATLHNFGALDIIVNNAGYTWDNVIQKTTDQQFQAMLDIHLIVPFRVLRAASTHIRESAKTEIAAGRRVMRKVVNITSISGTQGNAGQAGYAAGKAGVIGLTKTLAREWGRYNVNVNAVGFGLIDTRLIQPLNGDSGGDIEMHGNRIRIGVQPAMLDAAKKSSPLGRLGTPEEAAGAVLFFCSPLSDYVTGEVLICGGGFHF